MSEQLRAKDSSEQSPQKNHSELIQGEIKNIFSQIPFANIFTPEDAKILQDYLENCINFFGIPPERQAEYLDKNAEALNGESALLVIQKWSRQKEKELNDNWGEIKTCEDTFNKIFRTLNLASYGTFEAERYNKFAERDEYGYSKDPAIYRVRTKPAEALAKLGEISQTLGSSTHFWLAIKKLALRNAKVQLPEAVAAEINTAVDTFVARSARLRQIQSQAWYKCLPINLQESESIASLQGETPREYFIGEAMRGYDKFLRKSSDLGKGIQTIEEAEPEARALAERVANQEILVNFGGKVRWHAGTDNLNFWVLNEQGEDVVPTVYTPESRRLRSSEYKFWRVVEPHQIALKWKKDFGMAENEFVIAKPIQVKPSEALIAKIRSLEGQLLKEHPINRFNQKVKDATGRWDIGEAEVFSAEKTHTFVSPDSLPRQPIQEIGQRPEAEKAKFQYLGGRDFRCVTDDTCQAILTLTKTEYGDYKTGKALTKECNNCHRAGEIKQ